MELPVIGGRGAATTEALVRAIRKGSLELTRAVAAEESAIDGAVAFLCSREAPVRLVNCALDVHCPAGLQPVEVMEGIRAHFSQQGSTCSVLAPTAARFDEAWHGELARTGYSPRRQSLLLMEAASEPPECPDGFQIVSARALVPHYREFLQVCFSMNAPSPELAMERAECEAGFLDADVLDVLVARRDGRIAGSIGAVAIAEFGILRGLHVAADADRARTADVLLWHALDLARRSQFRQLISAVDESDQDTLAALSQIGMKRIETMESYVASGIEGAP